MALSKTEESCICGVLQRAAETDGIPVKFDAKMNEFHLVHGPDGNGRMTIRHCFFCGGKAPESLRDRLFARLTDDERWRLIDLTKPLKTIEDVIATLGEPDRDMEVGSSTTRPERDGMPEETTYYRNLLYRNLSESAEVRVIVYPSGKVAFSFTGKSLEAMSGDK